MAQHENVDLYISMKYHKRQHFSENLVFDNFDADLKFQVPIALHIIYELC